MTTKTVTRTVLGAYLQTHNLLGKDLTLLPHSTLNQKFDILNPAIPGNDISPGQRPTIKCLTIGNGGHTVITGSDGIPYTSPQQHRSTDFALFKHIPFAMRDIVAGDDVTSGTFVKSNYCLRKEETHDGTLYAVYYGRRVNNPALLDVTVKHFVTDNGVIITDESFVPNATNQLSPVPPSLPVGGAVSTIADYIAISSILPLVLGPDEIEELKNVAQILYGNEDLAIISEIGVCTGIDAPIVGSVPLFTDVKCCQIFTHIVTYHAAAHVHNGLEINLEMGATEPLLSLSET